MLTRESSLAAWLTALEGAGLVHEAGCPWMAWAATVDRDRPVAALLIDAGGQRALEAALTVMGAMPQADRDYWLGLIDAHSNSEAVKRWARAR